MNVRALAINAAGQFLQERLAGALVQRLIEITGLCTNTRSEFPLSSHWQFTYMKTCCAGAFDGTWCLIVLLMTMRTARSSITF